MKRILAIGSIVALSVFGFAGAANAAPADAACFGGIHKAINTQDALGLANVGEAVKALGGQAKNDDRTDDSAATERPTLSALLSAAPRLSFPSRRLVVRPVRGSLVGCDELDRVEDGACLFDQRRIDRFVGLAHRDHSALAVQVDHPVGFALARTGVPASVAVLRRIRVDAELAAVAGGDVDVALDGVVELEAGVVAHDDLDGRGAHR